MRSSLIIAIAVVLSGCVVPHTVAPITPAAVQAKRISVKSSTMLNFHLGTARTLFLGRGASAASHYGVQSSDGQDTLFQVGTDGQISPIAAASGGSTASVQATFISAVGPFVVVSTGEGTYVTRKGGDGYALKIEDSPVPVSMVASQSIKAFGSNGLVYNFTGVLKRVSLPDVFYTTSTRDVVVEAATVSVEASADATVSVSAGDVVEVVDYAPVPLSKEDLTRDEVLDFGVDPAGNVVAALRGKGLFAYLAGSTSSRDVGDNSFNLGWDTVITGPDGAICAAASGADGQPFQAREIDMAMSEISTTSPLAGQFYGQRLAAPPLVVGSRLVFPLVDVDMGVSVANTWDTAADANSTTINVEILPQECRLASDSAVVARSSGSKFYLMGSVSDKPVIVGVDASAGVSLPVMMYTGYGDTMRDRYRASYQTQSVDPAGVVFNDSAYRAVDFSVTSDDHITVSAVRLSDGACVLGTAGPGGLLTDVRVLGGQASQLTALE